MSYRRCEISISEKIFYSVYLLSIALMLLFIITAIVMACLPDKYLYMYEGDIISHTGTTYVDIPGEHRTEKIYDIITYKALDGSIKTHTIKTYTEFTPKYIKNNNFKYMYSYNIWYAPLTYMIGSIIAGALSLIFTVKMEGRCSTYTFEELDLFRPLKKFFGK